MILDQKFAISNQMVISGIEIILADKPQKSYQMSSLTHDWRYFCRYLPFNYHVDTVKKLFETHIAFK